MKRFIILSVMALAISLSPLALTSCKAWRTISTTSTYSLANDSVNNKTTTTISTKSVEEYQGVKK